jgi:hypothetical protein
MQQQIHENRDAEHSTFRWISAGPKVSRPAATGVWVVNTLPARVAHRASRNITPVRIHHLATIAFPVEEPDPHHRHVEGLSHQRCGSLPVMRLDWRISLEFQPLEWISSAPLRLGQRLAA